MTGKYTSREEGVAAVAAAETAGAAVEDAAVVDAADASEVAISSKVFKLWKIASKSCSRKPNGGFADKSMSSRSKDTGDSESKGVELEAIVENAVKL